MDCDIAIGGDGGRIEAIAAVRCQISIDDGRDPVAAAIQRQRAEGVGKDRRGRSADRRPSFDRHINALGCVSLDHQPRRTCLGLVVLEGDRGLAGDDIGRVRACRSIAHHVVRRGIAFRPRWRCRNGQRQSRGHHQNVPCVHRKSPSP